MVSLVIAGGQWGDEGKAKVTDLLSLKADYVVRYQGGVNAGHTVSVPDGVFKFHLIPSGILTPGKICVIGPGTVIEPKALIKEINDLKEKKISLEGLRISGIAHITMPWHILIDQATDTIGSTGRGIGPTYTDKAKRIGVQLHELLDREILEAKLTQILPKQNQTLQKIHALQEFTLQEVLEEYLAYGKELSPYISDTVNELHLARKAKKNIIYEGAQGTLLDITFGTYPYVTSSTPVTGGACTGAGIGPTAIDYTLGVFKAFITRVGDGPFPSEIQSEDLQAGMLRQDGTQWAEYGTTTGRMRRVGWFDAVLGRYAARINSFSGIALTKLDTLSAFDEILICVAYRHRLSGELIQDIPHLSTSLLAQCEPVFQVVEGWKVDIHKITSWGKLPSKARHYVEMIGQLLEVPVAIVSTGPSREDSIFLHEII
ncbi:MAG: adenylosuccinate synthase [Candidatus Caenarcaniphilales bacterium]|nr:adenylosuccinate synthase [Candidatus Caenarcaniphilales bacterium]